jgi:hypothetical protein
VRHRAVQSVVGGWKEMSSQQKMPMVTGETAIRSYLQLLARYERLSEISRQLNSTLDLGHLLNLITQAATELTNTEEASILLIDEGTGELRFRPLRT